MHQTSTCTFVTNQNLKILSKHERMMKRFTYANSHFDSPFIRNAFTIFIKVVSGVTGNECLFRTTKISVNAAVNLVY